MIYFERGSAQDKLSADDLRTGLHTALDALGERKKVIAVPPDYTRLPSQAGVLTEAAYQYYGDKLTDVLPALGTHHPMSSAQITSMFGSVPESLFRVHDYQNEVITLGRIEPEVIEELSEGKLSFDWPAQVNKRLTDPEYDLVLSIGQVVPHEVIGMANYNKNILVGTGGSEGIGKSHYLGGVYGLERIVGRTDTPVRALFNMGMKRHGSKLPIVYALTVVEAVAKPDGGTELVVRGLFVGDDEECYRNNPHSIGIRPHLLFPPLESSTSSTQAGACLATGESGYCRDIWENNPRMVLRASLRERSPCRQRCFVIL